MYEKLIIKSFHQNIQLIFLKIQMYYKREVLLHTKNISQNDILNLLHLNFK